MVVQEVNTGQFGSVSWRGKSEAIGVEEPRNDDGIYGKMSELYVNKNFNGKYNLNEECYCVP